MTIKLDSAEEQRILQETLINPEGAGVFFSLNIGGDLELGDYIYDGEWGSEDDGSIYVDLSIGARLPLPKYDDAPSTFSLEINGITIPQMTGMVSLPSIAGSDDAATDSTEFLGVSAKAEAGRITLDKRISYSGFPPEAIVKDALSRLPYSRGHTRVDPLKEPTLYPIFEANETVEDVLSRVEDQTPYKIRDNAYGGAYATVALEPSKVVESFRVMNSTDFPQWRPPPRNERRYSEVVVFRRNEDGSDAFEPQRATIHYPKTAYPPLKGAKLWIELDDATERAPENARSLALKMAEGLARGVFKEDALVLPFFDPLLEIQDVFYVYEDWEDLEGVFAREWMCWVDTFKHDFAILSTEVAYSAALLKQEEIKAPALAMGGLSSGASLTMFAPCDQLGDLLRLRVEDLDWAEEHDDLVAIAEDAPEVEILGGAGLAPSELLFPSEALFPSGDDDEVVRITCPSSDPVPEFGELKPDLIVFSSSVSWVSTQGDLLVIDTDNSGGHATVSGDLVTIQ